jgi:hypothetical protein
MCVARVPNKAFPLGSRSVIGRNLLGYGCVSSVWAESTEYLSASDVESVQLYCIVEENHACTWQSELMRTSRKMQGHNPVPMPS